MGKVLLLIATLLFLTRFCFGQNDSIDLNYALFIVKGDSCMCMKNYGCAFYNYSQAKKMKPSDHQITKDINSLIIKSFDKVVYFPDSTIKIAYRIKGSCFHGYAIEFDSTGNVLSIGKYTNGTKNGKWRYYDGKLEKYKHGKINQELISSDEYATKVDFQNLLFKLINEIKQK